MGRIYHAFHIVVDESRIDTFTRVSACPVLGHGERAGQVEGDEQHAPGGGYQMRPYRLRPAPCEESTADHVRQIGEVREEDQRDEPAPDHRPSVGTARARLGYVDQVTDIGAP